jgi:hypothetical protein
MSHLGDDTRVGGARRLLVDAVRELRKGALGTRGVSARVPNTL